MKRATPTAADVDAVIEGWRARMARPKAIRVTTDLRRLVADRLRLGYDAADLLALVRYAWEADEPGPRWWRGDNPDGKRYLHLDNLLRREKLAGRVHAALEWVEASAAAQAPDRAPDQADHQQGRVIPMRAVVRR